MPAFPEKGEYGIIEPLIKWLPEDRQIKVIEAILKEDQPIFWWLKYHMRRPSEAMVLYNIDYIAEQDAFIIMRTFSDKKMVNYTKPHKQRLIPCHSEFKKIMQTMDFNLGSPYFFINKRGRKSGKHYSHDCLVDLWKKACQKVGEDIDMYSGLKHSSCSQYVNEKGYSIDQVQMLTDHARRESVMRYATVQLEAKRRLMEGKVIKLETALESTT